MTQSNEGKAWIEVHAKAGELERALDAVQAIDPCESTEHDIQRVGLIRSEAKRMAQMTNLPADESDLPEWARSY